VDARERNVCSSGPPANPTGLLPNVSGRSGTPSYRSWLIFQNLFIAIYIDTVVSLKLKKHEVPSVVKQSPLTNESFRSAWNVITERFENKRLQVNLFNVQSIAQELGAALKELQNTI